MFDILAQSFMAATGRGSEFQPWERRIAAPKRERVKFQVPKEARK
ncbi:MULTISPECIES: hypothetical protein [unclassified Roseivivax]|nr:hypothetical protein [Roseivivax sp. GX 12232]